MSSALAIMLANFAEHKALFLVQSWKYFRDEKKSSLIIDGVRITDDGLIFVAYHGLNKEVPSKVYSIIHDFQFTL